MIKNGYKKLLLMINFNTVEKIYTKYVK